MISGLNLSSPAFVGTAGRRSAFSPADIAGLMLDLDADNITGITGDAVSPWPDASGYGYDGTQATSSARPVLDRSGPNGHSKVVFDGVDDYLDVAFPVTSQPVTIFVVAQRSAGDFAFDGLNDGFRWLLNFTGSVTTIYAGNYCTSALPDINTLHLFTCVFNGSSSELRLDGGGNQVTGTAGTQTCDGLTLGSECLQRSAFMNGYMARLLAYVGALGTTDREAVEAYLMDRYGL